MFLLTLNRSNLGKSLIMMVAIAASITLTVTMLSLSDGIRTSSRGTLNEIDAQAYVVPEDINPLLRELQRFDSGTDVMEEILESGYEIEYNSIRLRDSLFFINDGVEGEVITFGVVPDDEENFGQFNLVSGVFFKTPNDTLKEDFRNTGEVNESLITHEILISDEFRRIHDVDVGDNLDLTASLENDYEIEFIVLGVFEDTLARKAPQVMMHLGELQYILGMLERDTVSEILLSMEEDQNGLIEWSDSDDFRYKDVVDIHTTEKILSEIYKFTDIVNGFSAIVITVTVSVSAIFLSTLLMITTKQSARDIALLRTIGFPSWKLFLLLLRESVIIAVIGSAVGLLLGILLNGILNGIVADYFESLPTSFTIFRIDLTIILISISIYIIMSLASGLIPAVLSSMKPPMEALRGEGG